MPDNTENIGGVSITVEADLSDLQGQFDSAVGIATQAGQEISSALHVSSDTAGADSLVHSLQNVGNAAEEAGAQLAAVSSEPQTLAQYYDELEASALAASASTTELSSAVQESAGGLSDASAGVSELGASLAEAGGSVYDFTGGLSLSGASVESFSAGLSEASSGASGFSGEASHAGHSAEEASSGIEHMGESLIALGEAFVITEGLKEFASEALSTYGAVQKATISLTALTHSAEGAETTIEGLKAQAISDALSFPQLVAADQRMTAFGISTESIPGLLQDAANAAAATGNEFERTSQALIRMSASGMASGRMLVALGLTTADLGKVMGVTSDQVSKAFKAMDETERVEVLSAALQKFSGVAEQVAHSIPGEWQNVKTQFEFVMEDIGKAIAPVASELMSFARDTVIPAVKEIVEAFNSLPEPIRDTTVVVVGLTAVLTPLTIALGGVMLAAGPLFAAIATAAPIIGVLSAAIGAAVGTVALLKTGLGTLTGTTVSWKDAVLSAVSAEHEYNLITGETAEAQKTLADDVRKATEAISQQSGVARMAAAALAELSGHAHEAASAQTIAGDMASAHRVKIQQLTDAVTAAKNHLHDVTVEVAAGTKTALDLTKAYDAVTEASANLKAAYAQLSPEAKKLAEYHKLVAENTRLFRLRMAELHDPITAVSSATEVANSVTQAQQMAISLATRAVIDMGSKLVQAKAALDSHRGSVEAVVKAEEDLSAAQSRLNKLIGEIPDLKIDSAPVTSADAALGTLFTTLGQAPAFIPTLQQINEEWEKQGRHIDRVAKYNLPAAISGYQDYISKLEQVGAPLGQIYEAEERLLQLEVDSAAQSGMDATAQIVQLTNIREKTDALRDASAGLGNVYVGLMKTFDDTFDELGTQLTAVAMRTQSLGTAMHNVVMRMTSDIINTLVKFALGQLKDAIIGISSQAGGMGGAISGAVKALGGVAKGGVAGLAGGASGAQMQASVTQFHAAVVQFQTADTQFHAAVTQFNGAVTQLHAGVTQFSTGVTQFGTVVTQFGAGIAQFEAAITTFEAASTIFDTATTLFDTSSTLFDSATIFFDESAAFFDSSTIVFDSSVFAFAAAVEQFVFSQALSPLALFGFQGGGEVPGNVLGLLHPHEMVLDPTLADTVRSMVGKTDELGTGTTVNVNNFPALPIQQTSPNVNIPAPIVNVQSTPIVNVQPASVAPVNVPAPVVSLPPIQLPDISLPTIQIPPLPSINTPQINVPEPSIVAQSAPPVSVQAPSAPAVNVAAPSVNVAGPVNNLPAPIVNAIVNVPAISIPSISLPQTATPNVSVSTNVPSPSVNLPPISVPKMEALNIKAPAVSVPQMSAPDISIPPISAPSINIPPVQSASDKNPFVAFSKGFDETIKAAFGSVLSSTQSNVLPRVPTVNSAPSLPLPSSSTVASSKRDAPMFENCSFSGVTSDLVSDVMNKAVKATRRSGSRF